METPTCKDKLYDINIEYSNWKTDLQTVRCSWHAKQICKYYCIDCNKLICVTCFKISHRRHKYDELWTACRDKLLYITSRRTELCNDLLMIEDQLDTLAKATDTIITNHDVRRRQILQQDQQLKHSVKTHADHLILHLDNTYLEQECCLSKEEERVASKELKLENTKAIIESILQSHKAD